MIAACLVLSAWVTVLPTSVVGFQQLQPRSSASIGAFNRPTHAKTFHTTMPTSWLDDKRPSTTSLVMSTAANEKTQSTEIHLEKEDEEEKDNGQLFEAAGKGILRDYKARLPLLLSDITDGLNVQVRKKCRSKFGECVGLFFFHRHLTVFSSCSVWRQPCFCFSPVWLQRLGLAVFSALQQEVPLAPWKWSAQQLSVVFSML